MSNDWKSPEFWIAALTSIVTAVVAILVARGLLDAAEGQLWIQLAAAVIGPVAIIILGIVARSYLGHMTQVRMARLTAGIRE
ncbi:exported protein of unknown function (plasmid) [Candidatus Promineifilum breve]|uniref:Uncharacterized protein n=1 Tax=Candidatus Promineifilum breve TaxID=1806508 RepID=A0A160TAK9_9CHLR|nr:hypothetical protein [Candidatus Promineifilum breve]CUS06415.1 exported protein of unknown function [Candidatus Promineifilum breve]